MNQVEIFFFSNFNQLEEIDFFFPKKCEKVKKTVFCKEKKIKAKSLKKSKLNGLKIIVN